MYTAALLNTECPTRYRTRHLFNNFTTNEDIAMKFEADYRHALQTGTTDRHYRHAPQTRTTDTHHRHALQTHTTDTFLFISHTTNVFVAISSLVLELLKKCQVW